MPVEVAGCRRVRTRLLALVGLGVAVAGPAWLLARGVLPLDEAWVEKVGDFALRLRDAVGTSGWLAVMLDWLINGAAGSITTVLAGAQVLLSLFLLTAALAAVAGDEAGAWSLRRWAWATLVVDGLNLAATAGVDASSWLRAGLALAFLWLAERPPELLPLPLGDGARSTVAPPGPDPGAAG